MIYMKNQTEDPWTNPKVEYYSEESERRTRGMAVVCNTFVTGCSPALNWLTPRREYKDYIASRLPSEITF